MLDDRMWLSDYNSSGLALLSNGSAAANATAQSWFTARAVGGTGDDGSDGTAYNDSCLAFAEIDGSDRVPEFRWDCGRAKEEGRRMQVVCEGVERESKHTVHYTYSTVYMYKSL